jgi:hypothetical protein
MSDHLTKNTEYEEVADWCARCQRFTQHRRAPGQRGTGACQEVHQPSKAQIDNERRHANAERKNREQPRLFP